MAQSVDRLFLSSVQTMFMNALSMMVAPMARTVGVSLNADTLYVTPALGLHRLFHAA